MQKLIEEIERELKNIENNIFIKDFNQESIKFLNYILFELKKINCENCKKVDLF